ncbi:hypothetical protein SNOG_02881 [Parastagonospora nodorum SN15]|uniref:Uncharacterized protein n=1 Tax=Phaeosphaeria nodorum (strain SN15 / ATCC MYA-4574 / FGSC 10173) TaxID=321614 RepID=Q0UZD3_PHANO|nr:hypothetical protein SNOG_02881 [Parastagonospora nodorum SN15]EAT89612.1 hypothetical protein SNOG_02881 [Parastagonospora nodorum SN15]
MAVRDEMEPVEFAASSAGLMHATLIVRSSLICRGTTLAITHFLLHKAELHEAIQARLSILSLLRKATNAQTSRFCKHLPVPCPAP